MSDFVDLRPTVTIREARWEDPTDYLIAAINDEVPVNHHKIRIAIALLPYYRPKLSVVEHHAPVGTFAQRLEAAIARSNSAMKAAELSRWRQGPPGEAGPPLMRQCWACALDDTSLPP